MGKEIANLAPERISPGIEELVQFLQPRHTFQPDKRPGIEDQNEVGGLVKYYRRAA